MRFRKANKCCRFHFAFVGVFDVYGSDLVIVRVPAIRCCLYKMIRSAEEAAFAFLFFVSQVSGCLLKFLRVTEEEPIRKRAFSFHFYSERRRISREWITKRMNYRT